VLNGTKNGSYSVIFSLTSTTQIDKTKNKKDVRLFQALDENNLIVASSHSLNGLASKLGLSYAGVNYHLNRESRVYAKSLDLEVNVKKEGVCVAETISGSKDLLIPRYKSKLSRENLNLIETSINSLEKGYIFVYALDKKTIICQKSAAPSIFKSLNPKLSLNLEAKTLRSKANNMSTYINKDLTYSSELGKFYLAKNPNYAINANIPIVAIDIVLNLATFYTGKRECARVLSNILGSKIQLGTLSSKDWIDCGIVIHNKFILVSKLNFIKFIPVLDGGVELHNGSLDLTPYTLGCKVNFVGHNFN